MPRPTQVHVKSQLPRPPKKWDHCPSVAPKCRTAGTKNQEGSFSDIQISGPYPEQLGLNKGVPSWQRVFLKGFPGDCQAWESVPGTSKTGRARTALLLQGGGSRSRRRKDCEGAAQRHTPKYLASVYLAREPGGVAAQKLHIS